MVEPSYPTFRLPDEHSRVSCRRRQAQEQDWPFLANVHVAYGIRQEVLTASRKIRILKFYIFMQRKFHVLRRKI